LWIVHLKIQGTTMQIFLENAEIDKPLFY
jgi:hypothetical protein